jgi:Rad3-related DNA helicase
VDEVIQIGNPRKHGLPHDFWREEQRDAFEKCLNVAKDGGGNVVIEAPVGVGKSGIATALGSTDYTTVVVSNHGLIDQYSRKYGFSPIYGRQEYPCVLNEKVNEWKSKYDLKPTAADCHYENMNDCPMAYLCPYIEAKNRAIQARRMVCTYKYAALAEAVQNRPGILVMDEAHNAVEDLLDVAASQITDAERREYNFDPFPLPQYGLNGKGDVLDQQSRLVVIDWITKQISKIAVVDLFDQLSPTASRNTKMVNRLQDCLYTLSSMSEVFYYCNIDQSEDWRVFRKHKPQITMELKSLDVKRIVHKIRGEKTMSVFMSATIGTPHPLMYSLGADTWTFLTYKHPTPIDKRPIYDLGVEKMTRGNIDNNPSLYKFQANAIYKFVQSLDPSWRGIILTTSNYKVTTLRKMLFEMFMGRIWFPDPEWGLLERIISVDTIQGWGSGISLDGDLARFAVVAGVPFMNPSDRFSAIRMSSETGKRYGWWKPYSDVAQSTGRVTRGEKDDKGNYIQNVSALADGSATTAQARASYPRWMKEAILK